MFGNFFSLDIKKIEKLCLYCNEMQPKLTKDRVVSWVSGQNINARFYLFCNKSQIIIPSYAWFT